MTHWLLRVGDGQNLIRSFSKRIWGIQSTTPDNKHFLANVHQGDILWFVKNKSQGKLVAVATYRSHNQRVLGPFIVTSLTNDELGWKGRDSKWDTEIHYSDIYDLNDCELLTHIKSPKTIRKYKDKKCLVNLPMEYSRIIRYSKVIRFVDILDTMDKNFILP